MTRRYGYQRRYRSRRSRRTRVQIRRLARAWAAGIVAGLALLAAGVLFFLGGGRPVFEKGDLLVCVNGDGRVEFYWPEAAGAPAL